MVLYVADSELNISRNSTISQINNSDTRSSIIYIDNSECTISNTTFNDLTSKYFSTIISLVNNNGFFENITAQNFDKTLFQAEQGTYTFNNLNISLFNYNSSDIGYISDSQVFAFYSANLLINNSRFTNIQSLYGSPVIYMKNEI